MFGYKSKIEMIKKRGLRNDGSTHILKNKEFIRNIFITVLFMLFTNILKLMMPKEQLTLLNF